MWRNEGTTRKLARIALLSAVAIVLSIMENALTDLVGFALPGCKIGLANSAVLLALYTVGLWGGAFVGLVKILTSFFATGSVTVLWFSLAGTVLSVCGMWLLLAFAGRWFSATGISGAGAVLSNWGQLAVMCLLGESGLYLYYLPLLTVFGALLGSLVGFVTGLIVQRVPLFHGKKSEL